MELIPPIKREWDDGIHDNVRKITVKSDLLFICTVKFGAYIFDGEDHGEDILIVKTEEVFTLFLN